MAEETEIQTPETEETPQETKPELSKEAIADYLGVEVSSLDRLTNLDAMAREVLREKSELGRQKKAAPVAPVTDDDDDADLSTIDPKTAKLLRKFVEKEFGDVLSLPTAIVEDEVTEAFESFMDSHDDITPEDMHAVLVELEGVGIRPAKPTRKETTKFLKMAHDIAKSRSLDIESIRAEERAKALEELANEAKQKGEVVGIEKKRGVADKVDADKEYASKGFWDRL